MQITSVDSYDDLFHIVDAFPQHIVDDILATDWLNLPWQRQPGQDHLARRRIDDSALPWMSQWENYFATLMPQIQLGSGKKCEYWGTAWWVDEPGFTCNIHTDGEMPGAMQLAWASASENVGTTFYNYKTIDSLRHKFAFKLNSGYIMINSPDDAGYRHLQWHGMLTPVPANTFRVSSYSWMSEYK